MKFIRILLLASSFAYSQSTESLIEFNQLPDNLKDQILNGQNQENIDSSKVEDNFLRTDEDLEDKTKEFLKDDPFFGFSFFKSTSTTKAPVLDIPLHSNYELSFNDEVELLITGNKQAQYQLRVDLSGNIQVPQIGSVSVVNLTISNANEKISNLISEYYVGSQSFLSVRKPSLKKISIVGSVENPGTYLVNPFISLSEAIKYAGGLQNNSSIRNISVTSLDGKTQNYDLYSFIIYGSRAEDSNLKNGDIVFVPATTNFLQIEGNVLRPFNYEYKPSDTFEDLINFAQGGSLMANLDSLNINYFLQNQIVTRQIKPEDKIGNKKLINLFVGRNVVISSKKLRVNGTEVTEGIYEYRKEEPLSEVIRSLKFSDNLYPYYAVLFQSSNSGLSRDIQAFSLGDPDTYKEIVLKDNPELHFLSRRDIEILNSKMIDKKSIRELIFSQDTNSNYTNDNLEKQDKELSDEEIMLAIQVDEDVERAFQIDKLINKSDIKEISIGKKKLNIPLKGRITARALLSFFDSNSSVIESNISVVGDSLIQIGNIDGIVDSKEIDSISYPVNENQTFEIEIDGQVVNPGIYSVNSSVSLNDIYKMAGGFTSIANDSAVYLSREAVKEAERKALEGAQRIISDAVIENISNPLNSNTLGEINFESIIALSQNIELAGRVTGDFSKDSETADNFYLQEGDYIFVPTNLSTVTISGEVLNPSTATFEEGLKVYDYINNAGGLTKYADTSAIYLIRANGKSIKLEKNIFVSSNIKIMPGDSIIIPRNLDRIKTIPLLSVATKIIADISFAAASINAIRD